MIRWLRRRRLARENAEKWEQFRTWLEAECMNHPEQMEATLGRFGLSIDDVRRLDEPFPSLPPR